LHGMGVLSENGFIVGSQGDMMHICLLIWFQVVDPRIVPRWYRGDYIEEHLRLL
jgi:hypothetical protein